MCYLIRKHILSDIDLILQMKDGCKYYKVHFSIGLWSFYSHSLYGYSILLPHLTNQLIMRTNCSFLPLDRIFSKQIMFLCLLIFAEQSSALAQNYDLKFRQILKNQGLSSKTAQTVTQDSKGYIWIGTEDGLNRFDGYGCSVYRHDAEDSNTISGNYIYTIKEDKQKKLWIGTNSGLDFYDREKNVFKHTPILNGTIQYTADIKFIHFSPNGDLYCGGDQAIYKYVASKGYLIPFKPICSGIKMDKFYRNVHSLVFDKDNRCWLSSQFGLIMIDTLRNKFQQYLPSNNKLEPDITNTFFDSQGQLWVSGIDRIYAFDKKQDMLIEQRSETEQAITGSLWSIEEDSHHNIWFCSNASGLWLKTNQSNHFRNFSSKKEDEGSLSSNSIRSIHEDRQNILWLSTSYGINYVNLNKSLHFNYQNHSKDSKAISLEKTSTILEDGNNLWIGTDGNGLCKWDRKKGIYKFYTHDKNNKKSISTNAVLGSLKDSKGRLYFCGYDGAVSIYDEKQDCFHNIENNPQDPHSLSSRDIRFMLESSDHKIWVITNGGGINIYDPESKQIETLHTDWTAKTIVSDWCLTAYKMKDGKICIGSYNGLSIYDAKTKRFTNYNSKQEDSKTLSNPWVYSILEDSHGQLWVGTANGLNLWNQKKKQFDHFTEKNGLPNNTINGMQEDSNGNIWISTNNGISLLNPQKRTFKNFNEMDDLPVVEFIHGASIKGKDGNIYFGGQNGLIFFSPDEVRDNGYKPPVYLSNFMIYYKPVEIGAKDSPLKKHISETSEITLNHNQSFITFNYVALNYHNPEKNQYAYMMVNQDKDWNYVGTRREATYTNLAPGRYIFKVKASNNDGVWNEEGTSLIINVLPPWWKTWWFNSIVFFLVAGSSIGYIRMRIKNLKRQKRILEEKVSLRTKELQAANIELLEQKEEILQQNEEITSVNEAILQKKNELERLYNNQNLLSTFGQKITASLSFSTINTIVREYLESLLSPSSLGVGIYHPNRKVLVFNDFIENGDQVSSFQLDINQEDNLYAWSLINKKEVFSNDVSTEYTQHIKGINQNGITQETKSIIIIPLLIKDHPIGLLTVGSAYIGAYSDMDFANVRTLASYIAIALDNSNAYDIVNYQIGNIKGSINYAKTIQEAILPETSEIDQLGENFILYKPKDIVSGDFYWYANEFKEIVNSDTEYPVFLAVVDCTGHGVPGAFMSLIGFALLNQIVKEKKIEEPNLILEHLNNQIIQSLKQETTTNNDGMDVSMLKLIISRTDGTIIRAVYSGSKRPLIIYKEKTRETHVIKGDPIWIGGKHNKNKKFTQQIIEFEKGDVLYLSSDGLISQANPERGKFGSERLLRIIERIGSDDLALQRKELERNLHEYMKDTEQRDDITIIGIRT